MIRPGGHAVGGGVGHGLCEEVEKHGPSWGGAGCPAAGPIEWQW